MTETERLLLRMQGQYPDGSYTKANKHVLPHEQLLAALVIVKAALDDNQALIQAQKEARASAEEVTRREGSLAAKERVRRAREALDEVQVKAAEALAAQELRVEQAELASEFLQEDPEDAVGAVQGLLRIEEGPC
jgi:hypothetical protein